MYGFIEIVLEKKIVGMTITTFYIKNSGVYPFCIINSQMRKAWYDFLKIKKDNNYYLK